MHGEAAAMTDTGITRRSPQPSVGKRSAYDHYRTQKLDYMHVNRHPTNACLRYVRSQVECVTSSSRRPGRPAKARAAASMSSSSSSAEASPQRNDNYAPLGLDVDDTFDFTTLGMPYEIASGFGGLYPDADDCVPDLGLGDGRSPSMPALELPPSADDTKSCMQLAHVYQTLYEQLFRLQSSNWDLVEVLRVTCVHHHMKSSTSTCPSHSPSNPLATVATSAAEFMDILSSLVPPAVDPHDHSHLSIPDLLVILSCYILLINIYDHILAQLLSRVTTNPAVLDTALQSTPVLSLGGLAVPPAGHLPAHLVLVLLNNQVLPIEACLGLLDTLRVSDVKETPMGGLFSGAGGQALCMALVQVEIEQAVGGTGGLGLIVALREKRARVLEL